MTGPAQLLDRGITWWTEHNIRLERESLENDDLHGGRTLIAMICFFGLVVVRAFVPPGSLMSEAIVLVYIGLALAAITGPRRRWKAYRRGWLDGRTSKSQLTSARFSPN